MLIYTPKNAKKVSYFNEVRKKDMAMKKLSDFLVGEIGIVKKVEGEPRIRRRLFDMGITPGTEVFMRKKAPLGDPIEITIRGYELTLRNMEAQCIEMESRK